MSLHRTTLLAVGVLYTVAWLCSGCIGRALVGRKPVEQYDGTKRAQMRCDVRAKAPPVDLPPPARSVDLTACTTPEDAPCDPRAVDTDACMVTVDPYSADWNVGSLSCVSARLDVPAVGSTNMLTATDIRLEQVQLTLAATTPTTFQVTNSTLAGVSFALLGPWTLRLSANQALDDVRIQAGPRTQIVLEGEVGDRLTVDAPQGTVLLQDSTLQHTRVIATHIELENSQISDGAFSADDGFTADGSVLERVVIAAEDSLLTDTSSVAVEVLACEDLETQPNGQ